MATRPTRKAKAADTPSDAATAPAPAEKKTTARRSAAKTAAAPAARRNTARKTTSDTPSAEAKPARTAARRKASTVTETAVAAVPEKAKRAVATRAKGVRKAAPVAKVEQAASDAVSAVKDDAKAIADSAKAVAGSAKAAAKNTGSKAKSLLPDIHLPSTEDASAFAKTVGNQIVGAMNSTVGRVMIAELLMIVAGSLTAAAAKTETGKDAKNQVMNAGAKIGAAAAKAGAKIVDAGSTAASSGAAAATDAVDGAKGVAREVAQLAVSAVGGVVVEAATKVLGRGKGTKTAAALPAPAEPQRGTRRPPRI